MWVVGGAISNGGVVVRWAGEALAPDVEAAAGDAGPDVALLELAASVPAGSDGLVMLPYLLAERAPLWDPDLPGAYLGLRREHTRAHLVRAAVEGVCLQMRVDPRPPRRRRSRCSSVRATGGVFRSQLWREVMAATLDRPFYVIGERGGHGAGRRRARALLALGRTATRRRGVAARLARHPGAVAGRSPIPSSWRPTRPRARRCPSSSASSTPSAPSFAP